MDAMRQSVSRKLATATRALFAFDQIANPYGGRMGIASLNEIEIEPGAVDCWVEVQTLLGARAKGSPRQVTGILQYERLIKVNHDPDDVGIPTSALMGLSVRRGNASGGPAILGWTEGDQEFGGFFDKAGDGSDVSAPLPFRARKFRGPKNEEWDAEVTCVERPCVTTTANTKS